MNEIDNVINKIVLLIQYSCKKTNFRKIKLIFGLEKMALKTRD